MVGLVGLEPTPTYYQDGATLNYRAGDRKVSNNR
jgi:hypothetical protein